MTTGEINGFDTDGENFIVQVAGIYKLTSTWSFSGSANQEYHLSVLYNGVSVDKCHAERVIGTGGDVGSVSMTCMLALGVGDRVTPVIENVDSAGNPTIHDINVNLLRIGI